MSRLKAVTPEIVKPRKPIFILSGKSGVGKTFFALDLPKPYLIDTESGATRKQYIDKLTKVGGAYFGKDQGSQDFKEVTDQVIALATEDHPYKTLVIDSFTHLYLLAAAIAEEKIGNDFGRDKKEANRPTRQLMRWLEKLDMTVVLVCHSKDKWERRGNEVTCTGTTFDGYDKLEYILDLWLEVTKIGEVRKFNIRKSRIESFKEGAAHELTYEKFADLYGRDVVEQKAKPVKLATTAQIKAVNDLIEITNPSNENIEKVFNKYNVQAWEEMTADEIQTCIDSLNKKLKKLKEGA